MKIKRFLFWILGILLIVLFLFLITINIWKNQIPAIKSLTIFITPMINTRLVNIILIILALVNSIFLSLMFLIYNNFNEIKRYKKQQYQNIKFNSKNNMFVYGQNGSGKTTQIINALSNKKTNFFYYDCTFSKFLEKQIFNNKLNLNLLTKIYCAFIRNYYNIIVIDDIQFANTNELLNIWELLRNYHQQIVILSWYRPLELINKWQQSNENNWIMKQNILEKICDINKIEEFELNPQINSYDTVKLFLKSEFNWSEESYRCNNLYKTNPINILDELFDQITTSLKLLNSHNQNTINLKNILNQKIEKSIANRIKDIDRRDISADLKKQFSDKIQNIFKLFKDNYKIIQSDLSIEQYLKLYLFLICLEINDYNNQGVEKYFNSKIGKYTSAYDDINLNKKLNNKNIIVDKNIKIKEVIQNI